MFLRYWDYDGKSSLPEERIDIVGILDEDELVKFKNEAILIRAVKESARYNGIPVYMKKILFGMLKS